MANLWTILQGDALATLKTLPSDSIQCVVTSPPYWGLRDYGASGQLGLEPRPDCVGWATGESCGECYICHMTAVFDEVRRVLRADGVCFLNIGDSYYTGNGYSGGGASPKSTLTGGGGRYRKGSKAEAMFNESREDALHASAYDTSGIAPEGYQDRDCLCGNLCDVCRVVYRSHKVRNDGLLVAMLTASLSESSRERKVERLGHLPTSDLVRPADRIAFATQDRGQVRRLSGERLRAALESTIGESYPRLLDECLLRGIASECLLCARSLSGFVPGYAGSSFYPSVAPLSSAGMQGLDANTVDTSLIGDAFSRHTEDMVCDCSYQDYTTTPRQFVLKSKNLLMIPARLALSLQSKGWYVRSEIIWHKTSAMPESVKDRPSKAHEQIYLLTKSARYFYDTEAVKEKSEESSGWAKQRARGVDTWQYNNTPERIASTGQRVDSSTGGTVGTRNLRSVWSFAGANYPEAHFATFPTELPTRCIKAGTSEHGCCPECGAAWERVTVSSRNGKDYDPSEKYPYSGYLCSLNSSTVGWQPRCTCEAGNPVPCTVLDPFAGAGTTLLVATRLGRKSIGIELNTEYAQMAADRIIADSGIALDVPDKPSNAQLRMF